MPESIDMTDEELWDSPIGHRLRHYADKLLAAEAQRIEMTAKRKDAAVMAAGVDRAREVVSPLGAPTEREGDPWAYWKSPEMEGLRDAIRGTDGTIPAVQKVAKAYIASLQGGKRPSVQEPTDPPAEGRQEATLTDVAGALSFLLTGHAASDRGPFVAHDADGFHDEPYVILSLNSMRKVLDEIPQGRW